MTDNKIETADLIVRGGMVVTMNPARDMIRNGAVAVHGDRIVAIGKWDEIRKRFPDAETLGDETAIVTPGFIDAHMHAVHFLSKGLHDDLPFDVRTYRYTVPYEKTLTEDDLYLNAYASMAEMIRHGTTCFVDPGGPDGNPVARAARDIGMRAIVSYAPFGDPNEKPGSTGKMTEDEAKQQFNRGNPMDILPRAEALFKAWHGQGDGRVRIWFTYPVWFGQAPGLKEKIGRAVKELADKLGTSVTSHFTVRRGPGFPPVTGPSQHLRDYKNFGMLGPNVMLSMLGYMLPEDIAILLETGVTSVHCPASNGFGAFGYNTHGTMPEVIASAIPVGLGTDAGSMARALDMSQAMYIGASVHKDIRVDTTVIDACRIFEMATIRGAKAVMWEDEIGSLELGKKADITVLDTKDLSWHPNPFLKPIENFVYRGSNDAVKSVVIDGKVMLKDRALTTVDVPKLLKDVDRAAQAVHQRIGAALKPQWNII